MAIEEEESLKIYLEQIARVPLLTIEEEVELANRIRKNDEAARDHHQRRATTKRTKHRRD